MRNGPAARHFVSEWLELCTDVRALGDGPNELGKDNVEPFREHRHDQSIYSLLSKLWSIVPIPADESVHNMIFGHKQRAYNTPSRRYVEIDVNALQPFDAADEAWRLRLFNQDDFKEAMPQD
mmetsp:Transcript_25837/g.55977  ORF Transcript_25837/g.55977 Transcript_25837/m.55977 type:complete len:122 (+) Transcript_25837:65-430(+)